MMLGEKIRELRRSQGMTCKQLGELVGTSEAYIRAYEKGRRNPKLQSLMRLAKALQVEVEVFLEIICEEK